MEKNTFILVDDDPINNLISAHTVQRVLNTGGIQQFTCPETGLEYIKTNIRDLTPDRCFVLLLDLNMPEMSGWHFLDELAKLEGFLQDKLKVFILSSTINPADKHISNRNKRVINMISKPLNPEKLSNLVLPFISPHFLEKCA